MAKMGRPKAENPADKRITIRLNGEEHELLLEYTKNHNMTMTQVVKMAVLEKLMADRSNAGSFLLRRRKMACRKDGKGRVLRKRRALS